VSGGKHEYTVRSSVADPDPLVRGADQDAAVNVASKVISKNLNSSIRIRLRLLEVRYGSADPDPAQMSQIRNTGSSANTYYICFHNDLKSKGQALHLYVSVTPN
jgi:hypothetical protein